ncbi:MAG: DNA polymerase I [Oscillospiraceae bacterium]|nr:DNA polymerase I [Oscillospiraceae bacterium]
MKLLAVDGNSIVNRAYFGIKPLATKTGIPTGAIYGFLSILLKMQQETGPEAIVVTFDMQAPTFRHAKYDGYKAQRKGMPDDLARQMPLLKELLGHLGYRLAELEGYEADDLLGTFSRMCRESGSECVIATGDRDSFQLIGGGVTVRLASTRGGQPQAEIYDEAAVMEKYGVSPGQLIDVKALMGDSSDNIPGVAGVGEKTALSLVQKYGSLDNIYDNLSSPDIRDTLRAKLTAGRDMAYLSRELVVIDQNAPIPLTVPDCGKSPADNDKAYALMAKLELFSLMPKFGVRPSALKADMGQENGAEQSKGFLTPGYEVIFNSLPKNALESDNILDVLFSFEDGKLSALCANIGGTLHLCDTGAAETAKKILSAPCKKRTNSVKSLHRLGLEMGFEVQGVIFDLEIAAYILNPTAKDYGIGRLAAEYGVVLPEISAQLGKFGEIIGHCGIFPALAEKLLSHIIKNSQEKLLTEIELPLARVLADMEYAGFELDTNGLAAYGERLSADISELQAEIHELAGESFNINSPKQLGVILFEKLELPAGKKTKTGYSTNADVLDFLADKHAIIPKILSYRKAAKLKSTYVDGLLKAVGADGRIHTSFQQTLTRTGRISSVEPNMQNIPIRTELGSELRRFFRAPNGMVLLDADYSQIELRVLAHIAEDENMIRAFLEGADIHTITASQVFDMPPDFVTPLMRSRAKAVNFGIVYGIGAFSLSGDIGVPVHEADSYIKSYLQTYRGVRKYMDETVADATQRGYVQTLFGRRRYLPELASSNYQNREFGKRVAMNTPIQGTAADIIKIAMVRVSARLRSEGLKARLILQVHDELIVESPIAEAEKAAALLREEMEAAAELCVPMVAEVSAGKNWLEQDAL